ncbi:MAG: RNA-binding S4 domain-containing protein [Bacteroidales bacterium]|nr:RNA-binding S4 domain-containing protein [Bacteroidales bacterium]
MQSENNLRIDKWLWAVRIFKTRSIATNACKNARVMIDEVPVKPSKIIKTGEIIQVKIKPIIRTYEILKLSGKRMSAKLAVEFVKEITPQEEIDKLELIKSNDFIRRQKGTGRPTKKERRIIDKYLP